MANIANENRDITKTNTLDPAYAAKQNEQALQSRIDRQAAAFNEFANNETYNDVSRIKDGQKYWEQINSGNLNDLLAGKKITASESGEFDNLSNDLQANIRNATSDLASRGYSNFNYLQILLCTILQIAKWYFLC